MIGYRMFLSASIIELSVNTTTVTDLSSYSLEGSIDMYNDQIVYSASNKIDTKLPGYIPVAKPSSS